MRAYYRIRQSSEKVEDVLNSFHQYVKKMSHDFVNATNFLYLGRGFNFPAF